LAARRKGNRLNDYTMDRHDLATMASGEPLHVTLHIISQGEGPTVGISAGIHGDEPLGVEVLRRMAAFLKTSDELTGTVILLPVANPLAYERNTRNTPIDHLNLNRLFPGDATGWLSERIADTITKTFLTRIDAYIDLHSGGAYPVVDYVYYNNAPELSRAFGSRLLYQPKSTYDGSTESYANSRGLPAVTIELGGGLFRDQVYAERMLAGLVNMLRTLKVLSGPARPAPEQILMKELTVLRPSHGGIYVPHVGIDDLGAELPGGTTLGRIYNPQTFEQTEAVVAPFRRNLMVLLRENLAPVHPGDYLCMAGNAETAEFLPSSGRQDDKSTSRLVVSSSRRLVV
jgi:predicted deacylase